MQTILATDTVIIKLATTKDGAIARSAEPSIRIGLGSNGEYVFTVTVGRNDVDTLSLLGDLLLDTEAMPHGAVSLMGDRLEHLLAGTDPWALPEPSES